MLFQALKDACASGRAPPVQSKGGHVNWCRLFGNVSPAEALSSHYSAIFEFDGLERAAQESVMQSWHSRPAGTHEFVCDLPRTESALKRLHLEKSSLDGLTAEMLRQLPHDELIKMAAGIQEMFRSLSFGRSSVSCLLSCSDPAACHSCVSEASNAERFSSPREGLWCMLMTSRVSSRE